MLSRGMGEPMLVRDQHATGTVKHSAKLDKVNEKPQRSIISELNDVQSYTLFKKGIVKTLNVDNGTLHATSRFEVYCTKHTVLY